MDRAAAHAPEYAVCSTTYNCAPRVAASLASLRKALAPWPGTEFVVVDSLSTDGTREILAREAAADPRLRVIDLRCKRGRGRQEAYRASTARFVLRADLDTVYSPLLGEVLARHSGWRGRDRHCLGTRHLDILPRSALDEVGGWRDLNYNEDGDLWRRLVMADRLRWLEVTLGENWVAPDPERRQEPRLWPYLRRHFTNTRDHFLAEPLLGLRGKVRREAAKTRRPLRFALLTVPLMAVAWASTLGADKPRFDAGELEAAWSRMFIRMEDLRP